MKDDLRHKYKIKRKYFQHSRRTVADGAVADNFINFFGQAESFFVYYSFGSETDTHLLIKRLLEAGKEVYLPRVEGRDMVAVRYFEGDELKKSSLGVSEPVGEAYGGKIDVAVVPLLAVNADGYRLGYGGGFYDRFLKNCPCIRAGIGYDFQLTDELKADEWDEPLDIFISERGIYRFGKSTFSR